MFKLCFLHAPPRSVCTRMRKNLGCPQTTFLLSETKLLPAEIPCGISVNNSGDMELTTSPAGPSQLLKTLEHLRDFVLLFLIFGIVS